MEVQKRGRKWFVVGNGEGWIFSQPFPTRWKAELATRVFKAGGKVSDYWALAREHPKRKMGAYKVRAELEQALDQIKRLEPTPEEIAEYAEQEAGYGVVTAARQQGYFGPRLHDTWGIKRGGRVHIDIVSLGYHLMLNKYYAWNFIDFIRDKRKKA